MMAAWDAGIDERANFPRWEGEPVDHDATVTALLGRSQGAVGFSTKPWLSWAS